MLNYYMVSLSVFDLDTEHLVCFVSQVKIWDPSLRGSELRATLKGHTR